MKAAVYAVKPQSHWELWLSLDLQVDMLWWSGAGGGLTRWNSRVADQLVLLSPSIPLGWAVQLRENWRPAAAMDSWDALAWQDYAKAALRAELRQEQVTGGRNDWLQIQEIQCYGRRGSGWLPAQGEMKVWRGAELDRVWLADQDVRGQGRIGSGRPSAQAEMKRDWGACLVSADKPRLSPEELDRAARELAAALEGRSLLQPEAEALIAERLPGLAGRWQAAAQLAQLQGRLVLTAALDCAERAAPLRLPWRGARSRRALPRCRRCGSAATGAAACAACGLAGCAYCEACLALGRSRSCALLVRSAPRPAVRCAAGNGAAASAQRRWGLGAAQAEAAAAALELLAERRERSAHSRPERFLLWAVTGAGKTEITFPLLAAALAAGGRALVATPRRDVVLELAPRIARAFPAAKLAVLYGGSPGRWDRADITLATTHQLLRFHQGFDLVIIDEMDAFPFHGDPMLAYAAEQACKPGGTFIYLSATPPRELQRQVAAGRLRHAKVPVRFHGHPLPLPRRLRAEPVQRVLKQGRLPKGLIQELRCSLDRNAQIFLFVSRIVHIEPLLALLRRQLSGTAIEGTSSKDPLRTEKVAAFRERQITMLVTTTILERGVTVPRSDVFILDADSSLFDEAALVQMAGRAGRSKEDPAGRVFLVSPDWNRAQRRAVSQIRSMNKVAGKQGYLIKEERR
ncbi:helicase-related protein [Paenibacillus tengchongensis]|uniref:helicase-related protein n=1 Tax=Paenibacillus tengchongensis TaxID=2608684 RepID=UPI00124D907C|nr:helicase-related protein [Paenibacillus tengchongensis]